MDRVSSPFAFTFRNYSLLTKPGIIMGNGITTAAGFALGSGGAFYLSQLLLTLLGISLVIAASCVYNNYIDRHHDKNMERTKGRPLAKGTISEGAALSFASLLLLFGNAVLGIFVNLVAMAFAILGFGIYVFVYSVSKYQTTYSTLIGSVAGAMPPVVGYAAASGTCDLAALLLFSILVLWQMPHFYSISIRRLEDYKAAGIPILPLKRGIAQTKRQMCFYIMGFTAATSLLTAFNYTGYGFLAVCSLFGVSWLILCIRGLTRTARQDVREDEQEDSSEFSHLREKCGLKARSDTTWAKQMFLFSLVVILAISFTIALNNYML